LVAGISITWPDLRPSIPPIHALGELLRSFHARYAEAAMRGEVQRDAAARRRADLELARGALRGDARAEAELLDTLLPHMRAVARAILTNPADVDDAVQVALMRVLEGLSSYRGESSLVRWSRRVAAHGCLRLREQNQRRLTVVELSESSAVEAAVAVEAPESRLGEGLPRSVAEYLDRLPEAQREALVLRHVLDHSVAEIAELVGAPVDTIKSRLLYARRAVRTLIRRDTALSPCRPSRRGAGR